MEETIASGRNFEKLVEKILKNFGFKILQPDSDYIDLLIQKDDTTWAVETKYYKTQRAQLKLLTKAAMQIQLARDKHPSAKGMLITSCTFTMEQKTNFAKTHDLFIVDRQLLLHFASSSPNLTEQLYALLEIDTTDLSVSIEDFYGSKIDQIIANNDKTDLSTNTEEVTKLLTPPTSPPKSTEPLDNTGSKLCKELYNLSSGSTDWSQYEKLCEKILKYLFNDHLSGWSKQKRTDDELNRFDYVCRIKPSTEFWNFVIQQMHSRYIIFEFKNYKEQIKQGQVLTTEKYLLEKALRRVAIILTRKGAHESAIKMAQGAMRESGKLILILEDKDICKMLHMKENGSDPTDLLFEMTDDFFLSLPR
ncbi:restriction endonuclease [Pseudomonas atacamensis]|uniref:restriction endonuclease n=1 Tax=Pseudomonas atacamensis TaxID=2565368 RepID=UPI002B1E6117|nr:restriction endonuclease [Pseudomonas atacamensis]